MQYKVDIYWQYCSGRDRRDRAVHKHQNCLNYILYKYNSEADHPVLCRIWCTSLAVFCNKVHLAQG